MASAPDAPRARRCTGCGRPLDNGDHERCKRRRAYEPPRFCAECGRRMVVKVMPTSYVATCSAHGEVRSG